MADDATPISRADYAAKFGQDTPIPISRDDYVKMFPEESDFSKGVKEQGLGLASGILRGGAGLGDALLKGVQAMQGAVGDLTQPGQVTAGLNSVLNKLGVDNIENQAPDTIGHHIGEMIPAMAIGGEGLLPTIWNVAKAGLGGYFGSQAGQQIDEARGTKIFKPGLDVAGSIAALTIPGAMSKGVASIFSNPLTEDQALQQTFKTSGEGELAGLKTLKDEGIISPDLLKSNTPFKDVKNATENLLNSTSSDIGKSLEGTSLKTSEIFPTRTNLDTSKMSEKAASSVLKEAQDNLTRKAMIKLFPDKADNVDNLVKDYNDLWTQAKEGDVKAAEKYKNLTDKIQNIDWSGKDLWDIRQYYDKNINWMSDEFKGKAPAWLQLRDSLQKNILNIGDKSTKDLFSKYASVAGVQDNVNKLGDLELAGRTQQAPIGQRAIKSVASPLQSTIKSIWGNGRGETEASSMLPSIFGQTNSQKLKAASWLSDNAVTGSPSSMINNGPSIFGGQNDTKASVDTPSFFLKSNAMDSKDALSQIKADPYLHATALAESGLDPNAKNDKSSASGIFQFTNSTAKALGVKDTFNVADSLQGMQKLRAENEAKFGNDPFLLYSAHYLGMPVLEKALKGEKLDKDEQDHVDYLNSTALPRFKKIYAKISDDSTLGEV